MDLNYWKLLLARVWKMDTFDSDGFKGKKKLGVLVLNIYMSSLYIYP